MGGRRPAFGPGDPIREAITVFGDGEQTRDFIYARDVADELSFAAETPGVTAVFKAGYGGLITINGLADGLIKAAGSKSKIVHIEERPGDVRHSRATAGKLRAVGWMPRHTLDEGLALTLGIFKRNG